MKLKSQNTTEETPSFMKRKTEPSKQKNKIGKPNIHTGHRERLKNQYLQNGLSSLTEIQQLELLLFFAIPQKDTNPIAHKLLDRFGSLKQVLSANIHELTQVEGIKENTALFLKLTKDITTVCNLPKVGKLINGTDDAKTFCSKFYNGVTLEQFHVVCLTTDNKVIGTKMIKAGTTDQIKVDIRDITEYAMSINCNRIVVSHNHPNGEGRMSDEDFKFTYSLLCSCLLNSIDLLDHIIVGTNSNYSLAEHLILEKLTKYAHSKVLIPKNVQITLSNLRKNYVINSVVDTDINLDIL